MNNNNIQVYNLWSFILLLKKKLPELYLLQMKGTSSTNSIF